MVDAAKRRRRAGRRQDRLLARWGWAAPVLLAVVVFGLGLGWGLPSAARDAWLYPPAPGTPAASTSADASADADALRSGAQIDALAGGWEPDPDRGADVALHPLAGRDRTLLLNADDADRAALLRRYKLYSNQPDEMITFRALAQMRPSAWELDPRLYQYGGLWVYPVGALLKVASALRLITVTADRAFYLDHPDAFGRFYVVARAYSAAWGLAAVWATWAILRRVVRGGVLPMLGAAAAALLPVAVDLAHEAKPHLAGAALLLLATVAASNFVRAGSARWALIAGALCGAAAGMVLSMIPALLLLPIMALARRDRWGKRIAVVAAGVLVATGVYFAANPYVAAGLLSDPGAIKSNLANSSAMYRPAGVPGGARRTAVLLLAGASTPLALAGLGGAGFLAVAQWRRRRETRHVRGPIVPRHGRNRDARCHGLYWLLAGPATAILAQCVPLAANKPGEFGRFLLVPDLVLTVLAFAALGELFQRERARAVAGSALALAVAAFGAAYVRGFLADASPDNSRTRAAAVLSDALRDRGGRAALTTFAEPAPYCLPPVDLFRWQVLLAPRDAAPATAATSDPADLPPPSDATVRPLEEPDELMPWATPISWADKPFALTFRGREARVVR